jgi:hypothetical protein
MTWPGEVIRGALHNALKEMSILGWVAGALSGVEKQHGSRRMRGEDQARPAAQACGVM